MPAKKLVVSTYLQYVLIALGALLLFVFVRQIGAVFAVPVVAIIAAASRYLRETLLFERWRKALVSELAPEEERPASSETSGEEPVDLGSSAVGKG